MFSHQESKDKPQPHGEKEEPLPDRKEREIQPSSSSEKPVPFYSLEMAIEMGQVSLRP